jgi:quaternary ammonium compound-resistance protein SugE
MRRLPLGTSYAIWTGIGAVGTAIIGIVRFNEPRDWPRLLCIGMIVMGIVGLKLLHRDNPPAAALTTASASASPAPNAETVE